MRVLMIVLLFSVLVGCRTRPPVNNYPSAWAYGVQMDEGLASDLQVVATSSVRTGDLLRLQATLQNQTKKQLPFEYRIEWFDAQGMLVETPASKWTIRHPYGGESVYLQAIAPTPAVTNWTLKLKRRK